MNLLEAHTGIPGVWGTPVLIQHFSLWYLYPAVTSVRDTED